jgi:hypothetical protein
LSDIRILVPIKIIMKTEKLHLQLSLAAAALTGWAALLPVTSHGQTEEADYQLQSTYDSSVGTIGALTTIGSQVSFTSATVDGNPQEVLSISANDTGYGGTSGVQAQTGPNFGISDDNYSVVLLADFNLSATGLLATKVLDFANLSSDAGLYVNDTSGLLEFINGSGVVQTIPAPTSTAVVSGTYAQIVLTRNGTTGLVSVYEDGTLALSFTDSSDLAVLGDATATGKSYLTLFKDDGTGVGDVGGPVVNESSEGDIARLRIYDGVLSDMEIMGLDTVIPEPGSLALFVLGGVLLLGCGRAIRSGRLA